MNQTDSVDERIKQIWEDLAKTLSSDTGFQRNYRRLDLEKETGVRLGCSSQGNIWELFVEIGRSGESFSPEFPRWKGMDFEIVSLDVPKQRNQHIRLFLEQVENRDIFVTVSADLVRGLNGCLTNESRRREIVDFFTRWNNFFDRHGMEGLSSEEQRGLYGELWWLHKMIYADIDPMLAVTSWKGCERAYQDFEMFGHAVEIKTTMTKEPRKVWINNERQLNEQGLKSLHLFVLTLIKIETDNKTLPELIKRLRDSFSEKTVAHAFENSLRKAGYLDVHARLYKNCYSLLKEDFYQVKDGFPKITDMPQGLGDLHYTLLLAACEGFKEEVLEYYNLLRGNS